ncbi:hypothetical protein HC928_18520 [bacterium]|nr:hypothetical protein [bacterium]
MLEGTVTAQVTCLEICAGAGGQALGLEQSGFEPQALVEIDSACCNTFRLNRPHWKIVESDLRSFDGKLFAGVDLLAGGVPCPPFSKVGKQLGKEDDRDLFPEALRLVDECRPRAVMLENVRGFLDSVFEDYRGNLKRQLEKMGYIADLVVLRSQGSSGRPRRLAKVGAEPWDLAQHNIWLP